MISLARASTYIDGRAVSSGIDSMDNITGMGDEQLAVALGEFYDSLPVDPAEAHDFASHLTGVAARGMLRGVSTRDAVLWPMHHALACGLLAACAERVEARRGTGPVFGGASLDVAMQRAELDNEIVEPPVLQPRIQRVVDRSVELAFSPDAISEAVMHLREAGMGDPTEEIATGYTIRSAIGGAFAYGLKAGVELERDRQGAA